MVKNFLKRFQLFIKLNELRHYIVLLLKTKLGLIPINNSIEHSRDSWRDSLVGSKELKDGFGWGDQGDEINQKREVQYKQLRELIVEFTDENKVVLDLGSYDGFWTQFVGHAKGIICVDLFPEGFEVIKERFGFSDKIKFYQTSGNELNGVDTNSVDLIFSFDSLIRAPKEDIGSYFQEFHRVLKPGGRLIAHLPSTSKLLSLAHKFTPISNLEIKDLCKKNLTSFEIREDLIEHVVIVLGEN